MKIQATISLLTDGDLADLPELKERLVQLKNQRRDLLARSVEKDLQVTQVNAAELRRWANTRMLQLKQGLAGELPTHELRNIVHSSVDRIEIDPHQQTGTIYLPKSLADSLSHAYASRVTSGSSSHS